jgi:NAD(P)-dependent dehydrogenase (short-subunit alcohol dehydrogenase family)
MSYFDLTGERALIVGSGGIGGAIAEGAAASGAEIVLADANAENLEKARAAVEKAGGRAHVIRQEIRSRNDIVALYERVNKTLPDITLSVNAVGLSVMAPAIETTEEEWRTVLSGFLDNVFWSNQQAAKIMLPRRRGKIVNLASMSGIVVTGNRGASYAAAKAGVIQLSRALAMEWIAEGVYVNSISPGTVRTALTEGFLGVPELKREIEEAIPLGRVARPDDIVGPALFLLSKASDYVVGQNLVVDGGYTVR